MWNTAVDTASWRRAGLGNRQHDMILQELLRHIVAIMVSNSTNNNNNSNRHQYYHHHRHYHHHNNNHNCKNKNKSNSNFSSSSTIATTAAATTQRRTNPKKCLLREEKPGSHIILLSKSCWIQNAVKKISSKILSSALWKPRFLTFQSKRKLSFVVHCWVYRLQVDQMGQHELVEHLFTRHWANVCSAQSYLRRKTVRLLFGIFLFLATQARARLAWLFGSVSASSRLEVNSSS